MPYMPKMKRVPDRNAVALDLLVASFDVKEPVEKEFVFSWYSAVIGWCFASLFWGVCFHLWGG